MNLNVNVAHIYRTSRYGCNPYNLNSNYALITH